MRVQLHNNSDSGDAASGVVLVGGCALNVKLNEELQARQDRPRYSVTTVHHGAAAELPTVACFARFRPTGPPRRLREHSLRHCDLRLTLLR